MVSSQSISILFRYFQACDILEVPPGGRRRLYDQLQYSHIIFKVLSLFCEISVDALV